ncbi:MAG: chemotaxis protein CheD [Granulosicoccus sp.]
MKSQNVHIGEVKTGRGNQELHTILGSCIGIGFLWKKRGFYGLAHCLLPRSPAKFEGSGGRYVDQAINTLCERMDITNLKDVRAIVAGGANMTSPGSNNPEKLIGYQNAQSAIELLDQMKVRIIHEDTGGYEGRKVSICCESGDFEVRAIPRIAA